MSADLCEAVPMLAGDKLIKDWTGTKIYGCRGTSFEKIAGVVTESTRRCLLDGCGGTKVMVRWPDGHKTWPCCKGIVQEKNHLRIV